MTAVAVLIDADNVAAAHSTAVFSFVRRHGTPTIKRVYGGSAAMVDWLAAAEEELCEMRPQRSVSAAKNGADIALAIDAMDILRDGSVAAFCIVSNDRDFVPLAVRLRASAKKVLAVCRTSNERYAKAFDALFELEPRFPIVEAFRKIAAGREISLSEAGKLLREMAPDLVPPPGKGLKRVLDRTGRFVFSGEGGSVLVRLKA